MNRGGPQQWWRESMNLLPWMSAIDNASYGLRLEGVGKAERDGRAGEMIMRLGLGGRERAWPKGIPKQFGNAADGRAVFGARRGEEGDAATGVAESVGDRANAVDFVTHDVEEAILLKQRILILSEAPGRMIAAVPAPFFSYPWPFSLTLTDDFPQLKCIVHPHSGHWTVWTEAKHYLGISAELRAGTTGRQKIPCENHFLSLAEHAPGMPGHSYQRLFA